MAILGLLTPVGVELIARYGLGLGTPPLTVAHPTIEYMFAPNQDVYRYHNHVKINSSGMRSDEAPTTKTDLRQFRVLMLGDSVLNGGNLTDHEDLATTILQKELAKALGRPVWVGNVSAGSWGPPNQLAWVKEYGLYDADVVVLQISAHDIADVPRFAPLDPDAYSTEAPWSATTEGLHRFLPRYLPWSGAAKPKPPADPDPLHLEPWEGPENVAALQAGPAPVAITAILDTASAEGAATFILYHVAQGETQDGNNADARRFIVSLAQAHGARVVQPLPFGDGEPNEQVGLYRDGIHPNAAGQRRMADRLLPLLLEPSSRGGAASSRSSRGGG